MQTEITQEQLDHEMNWVMPEIQMGEPITYFSQWNNPARAVTAFVTRISTRSIECRIFSNEQMGYAFDVLHKDDPRLARNQNMQRNGSWDYAPTYKRMREVERRLAALEELVTSPEIDLFDKATGLSEIMYAGQGSGSKVLCHSLTNAKAR